MQSSGGEFISLFIFFFPDRCTFRIEKLNSASRFFENVRALDFARRFSSVSSSPKILIKNFLAALYFRASKICLSFAFSE